MENKMYHRYGTNMYHIAHKCAELSAIPAENSRLLPETSLRKLNSIGGRGGEGRSMQNLMVDSVRMKKRRRNSAQSKVIACRPVR